MKRIVFGVVWGLFAGSAQADPVKCAPSRSAYPAPAYLALGAEGKIVGRSHTFLDCEGYMGFVNNADLTPIETITLNGYDDKFTDKSIQITAKELADASGKKIKSLADVIDIPFEVYEKLVRERGLLLRSKDYRAVTLTEFTATAPVKLYGYQMDDRRYITGPDFGVLSAVVTKPNAKGCYYTKAPVSLVIEDIPACVITFHHMEKRTPMTWACLQEGKKKSLGCPTCDECLYQDEARKGNGLPYIVVNTEEVFHTPQELLNHSSVVRMGKDGQLIKQVKTNVAK